MVPLARALTRKNFCHKPWWGSQVVILGFGATGKLMCDKLKKNPVYGLKPYAVLDDDPAKLDDTDGLITGPLSRCLEITAKHKISYGIVCMPGLSRTELLDLLDRYGQCFGHLLVIPNLVGMTSLGITAKEIGGIVGLEVKQQLLRPWSKFLKRSLDLAITILLAPIVIPLVALFAILVKLEDAGPAFYSNERIGHAGRRFNAWKLRSMVTNGDSVLSEHFEKNPLDHAHWHATQKLKHDPRLTRIGRFIRKTSIDELPQFWNVFIGEMSVVGPRPMLEKQVNMYGPAFNLYKQVRPGITGLWQVSGRNHLTFAERATLDKYVIQNWSVWLDIYILTRTAGQFFLRTAPTERPGTAAMLRVFTPTLRILWIAVVIVTIISEVLLLPTNPPLSPIPHYSYKVFKLLLFIAVGYLAPLAFWRFNALNRGIMLAAISAMGVETLQGVIGQRPQLPLVRNAAQAWSDPFRFRHRPRRPLRTPDLRRPLPHPPRGRAPRILTTTTTNPPKLF